MARFFKDYDRINLKILNDVKNTLKEEDKNELNINPKYLAMIHIKHCDFCQNLDDKDTFTEEIKFYLGYQICDNCSNKNIGKTFIKLWYINNNCFPINYFSNNSNLLEIDKFRIQRSSGLFEDDWLLDEQNEICLIKKEDKSEDILIPLYKSNKSIRSIYKNVLLSEICRFNNLDETKIIFKFKELFEEFKKN